MHPPQVGQIGTPILCAYRIEYDSLMAEEPVIPPYLMNVQPVPSLRNSTHLAILWHTAIGYTFQEGACNAERFYQPT